MTPEERDRILGLLGTETRTTAEMVDLYYGRMDGFRGSSYHNRMVKKMTMLERDGYVVADNRRTRHSGSLLRWRAVA